MTDYPTDYPTEPPTGDAALQQPASERVDLAKEQASRVKDHAMDAGGDVADTVKEQAASVAGEAKAQGKDLLHQTQEELRAQAELQQRRVAEGLRSVSEEFSRMATSSEGGGVAADLVQQAAQRTGGVASWLDARDPGSLLSEVRRYASRKPGMFIAIAATAGLVAGRLTRSMASNASDQSSSDDQQRTAQQTPTTGSAAWAPPSTQAQQPSTLGQPAAGEQDTPETPVYSSLASDNREGL
jgi:hypothetical protein